MPAATMNEVLALLDAHYEAFFKAKPFADQTCHPVPCDTRAWSQILVSLLTGIEGRKREKGTDLVDGSDVKAANCWSAIDTPRFNGVIPAGRLSKTSRKEENVSALDATPFIFFVLWDDNTEAHARVRIWAVRPGSDRVFRQVCQTWYMQRKTGETKSTNFQLHPPRFRDDNVFRNMCGNLDYPLLFCAIREEAGFKCIHYDPETLQSGTCKRPSRGKREM
jgi:hypothetical protein